MLPMYLRKEPVRHAGPTTPKTAREVAIYRDEAATQRAGYWAWWSIQKPRKGCKRVMFNCYNWRAVWLPDLEA